MRKSRRGGLGRRLREYSIGLYWIFRKLSKQWWRAISLYLRDPKVDALAEEVMRRFGTTTKTEAVRVALENQLKLAGDELSMEERIRRIHARVAARMGGNPIDFDQKTYMDEMWED